MLGDLFDSLLTRGVDALDAAQVEYSLIGGVAMIAAGRERYTRDMDVIVLELSERLTQALQERGFTHDPARDRFTIQGVNLQRYWVHLEDIGVCWSLDVQQADSDLYAQVLRRTRRFPLQGREIAIATPEDLLVLKLLAYRPVDRADCINLCAPFPIWIARTSSTGCIDWGWKGAGRTCRPIPTD